LAVKLFKVLSAEKLGRINVRIPIVAILPAMAQSVRLAISL